MALVHPASQRLDHQGGTCLAFSGWVGNTRIITGDPDFSAAGRPGDFVLSRDPNPPDPRATIVADAPYTDRPTLGESSGSSRPTRVRFGVMGFLLALSFLTYFDRVCIVRSQQEIQAELKLDNGQMGLVFGAFWLAYALFEIPGGWLGDRNGARRTLTRIVLAWSICTVLTGFATGFASLLAYRFLFGVGEAGAYPNMARIQSAWLPASSRGRAGGLLWLAARWGGAFSPFLFSC